MTEFIRERYAFLGNGDRQTSFKTISAEAKAIEVAVLPESRRIETRFYGRSAFDQKDIFSNLLLTATRMLPEENSDSYVKPPESLFDGDWVDPYLVYSRDRAVLTGSVLFSGFKETVPPEIKLKFKVEAETIEDPEQLRQSLIASRVIPFSLA